MEKLENMISEKMLKIYAKNHIELPQLTLYIENYYLSDIYDCFVRTLKQLKHEYNPLSERMSIIIDLDETFLQNDDFYPFTLGVWKQDSELFKFYLHHVKKNQFGPILPFMYILYSYCISKGIRVIFVSGRLEYIRKQTVNNLNFYGVYHFDLYLAGPKWNKIKIIKKLEKKYNILAVLNDQNDSPHAKLIKFPQLYVI